MSEIKRLLDDDIDPELGDLLRSADGDGETSADREGRILSAVVHSTNVVRAPYLAALPPAPPPVVRRATWWTGAARWTVPLAGLVVTSAAVLSFHREPDGAANGQPLVGHVDAPRSDTPRRRAYEEVPSDTSESSGAERVATPFAAPSTAPEQTVNPIRVLPDATVRSGSQATPRVRVPSSRYKARDADAASVDAAAPATSTKNPSPSLADEFAVVDGARAALAAARAADALARIQTYRREVATPHFADEADALEVQALKALGRDDEARSKAESFLTRQPNSPYARRVRSVAGLKE